MLSSAIKGSIEKGNCKSSCLTHASLFLTVVYTGLCVLFARYIYALCQRRAHCNKYEPSLSRKWYGHAELHFSERAVLLTFGICSEGKYQSMFVCFAVNKEVEVLLHKL